MYENEPISSNIETVKVVKVNKARITYFFTKMNNDIGSFLNSCEIEFRITIGQNWSNYLAVNKGNMLNFFTDYEFKRGSEVNYTRNLMLFTDQLEGLNLKLSLGLTLDSESDLSHMNEIQLKPYMNKIFLPPEDFFNNEICMNGVPPNWIKLIRNENTLIKQNVLDTGVKLYHPDGKPYTKLDYERVEKYGHIAPRLMNTTIA